MLLSLVTAQGEQTLHLLDISLMSTYDSSIVFLHLLRPSSSLIQGHK